MCVNKYSQKDNKMHVCGDFKSDQLKRLYYSIITKNIISCFVIHPGNQCLVIQA